MTNVYREKGFTLIELLVVIAIIGILASIVVVSLTTAQEAAEDSAIESEMRQLAGPAQMYYSNNNRSFDGLCTADDTHADEFQSLLAQAAGRFGDISDDDGVFDGELCRDGERGWVAVAEMSDAEEMFCSDNDGQNMRIPGDGGGEEGEGHARPANEWADGWPDSWTGDESPCQQLLE